MPTDNRGQPYTYKSSGTNPDGNHYCTRDYGPSAPNQNPYHYTNRDGSYYYSNADGSKYYNDGKGNATYTPPGGGEPRACQTGSQSNSASASASSPSKGNVKTE